MNIPANRMDRGFEKYKSEIEKKALEVLNSGWYILGKEVESFEKEFAKYVGAKYCVGLGNGLDALWIAVKLLGIGKGDEVIVQSNAYIASVMGITMAGATPVFVEPNEFYNIDVDRIEKKITSKTKAIMVVHLYGQSAQMSKICEIASEYGLEIIEDCAQSHGAMYNGKITGTFGKVGCFSFYPTKNLGAFGDAGAIVTDEEDLAQKFRTYRNYGSQKRYYNEMIGTNSRLDEMQAGLLRIRLSHLDLLNAEREQICNKYLKQIINKDIITPKISPKSTTVWHQFVIKTKHRENLIQYLTENGVGSTIHYPIPPHLSKAYGYLGFKKGDFPIAEMYAEEVLSIPLFNGMTDEEMDYVVEVLNRWRV